MSNKIILAEVATIKSLASQLIKKATDLEARLGCATVPASLSRAEARKKMYEKSERRANKILNKKASATNTGLNFHI